MVPKASGSSSSGTLANNMKRVSVIAAVCVTIAAVWLLLPPREHVWTISDATKSQEHRFTDWLHSIMDGEMAIRVTGDLTAPAILDTPLGQMNLPAGKFDFITYTAEAWSSSAILRFSPTAGTKGSVKAVVCLGSNPMWVQRPPQKALPILYTGGWTAYYDGTDTKAWQGGFHLGQKWGEFVFWDQSGNVTKREEWENGKKKNG